MFHTHGTDNNAKTRFIFLLLAIGLSSFFVVLKPTIGTTNSPDNPLALSEQSLFFRGHVVSIDERGEREDFNETFRTQDLVLQIDNGIEKGHIVTTTYESSLTHVNATLPPVQTGDRLIIGKQIIPGEGGGVSYFLSDFDRLRPLTYLFSLFCLLVLVLGWVSGFYALAGLGFSFIVITQYIIPWILVGSNPLLISLSGACIIGAVTLYLSHGVSRRINVAVVSTFLSLLFAFGVSYAAVKWCFLFGIGDEAAFYLKYAPIAAVNLSGLLLGGILIGVMGILDDITTAQSAAVEEIHRANASLGMGELYRRGLSVGREHIISLVNTLVLAYAGASLPLLLLFYIYPQPIFATLNQGIVAEEVVRTLAGSMTLLLSVPVTTAIAAFVFGQEKK